MGRTTRIGVVCSLVSLAVLLLASSRHVTGPVLGLPAVASGLVLCAGLALDRRERRSRPGAAANWAEEFTARVRSERAAARDAAAAVSGGAAAAHAVSGAAAAVPAVSRAAGAVPAVPADRTG